MVPLGTGGSGTEVAGGSAIGGDGRKCPAVEVVMFSEAAAGVSMGSGCWPLRPILTGSDTLSSGEIDGQQVPLLAVGSQPGRSSPCTASLFHK